MMVYALSVQKYTDYYLEFVQGASSDEIEAEIETICSALENCYEIAPDWQTISTITDTLFSFFKDRGYWALAIRVYQMAVEAATQLADNTAKLRHKMQLGRSYFKFGAKAEALDLFSGVIDDLLNMNGEHQSTRTLQELLIDVYIYRCEVFYDAAKWELAQMDAQRALSLAELLGDQYRIGRVNFIAGVAKNKNAQREAAADLLKESLRIAREQSHTTLEERSLDYLARVYEAKGDLETAKDYYQQSVALARQLGNSTSIAAGLNGLAVIAMMLNDLDDALIYLNDALDIFKSNNDLQGITATHTNFGIVRRKQGHYQQAHQHHKQAYHYARDIHDIYHEIINLSQMGHVALSLKEHDKSSRYLLQAAKLNRQHGFKGGEASCLGNLGENAFAQQHYEEALDYYQQCMAIFDAIGAQLAVAMSYGNTGKTYARLGDYERAHHDLVMSIQLASEMNVESVMLTGVLQLATLSLPERIPWLTLVYHHPNGTEYVRESIEQIIAEFRLVRENVILSDDEQPSNSATLARFQQLVTELMT